MSRPFLRHVYPHPAHPGPPSFTVQELAAWDVELLVWAVRARYWRADPFEPTVAGAAVLDGFLTYYSSDVHLSTYDEHRIGELLLYIKQIEWAAPGESEAETEERLAHLEARFNVRIKQRPEHGDFQPDRYLPHAYDLHLAEEAM